MSVIDSIREFLWEYFIRPMYTREGYNAYNTLVYGFLLGVGIIYSYKIVERLKIKIDERLIYSVAPMIVFGSTTRALVDAGVLPKNPLILTPGIFFTAFFLILPALVIDSKTKKYPKITVAWGSLLSLIALYLFVTNVEYPKALYLTIIYTLIFSIPLLPFYKKIDRIFFYALLAHMLDIASTLVAIVYLGYYEVHWIEGWLSKTFDPFVLYPWKLFILAVIYYGLKYLVPNEEERRFWYVAVFILGFAPGVRDTVQMVLMG
jgi:uncharacterized membrane protein